MSTGEEAVAEVLQIRTEKGVRWLTLNRPNRRNALNAALVQALRDALRDASADPGVRVVVLAGAGLDFCGGADIRELRESLSAPLGENLQAAEALGELFVAIRRCDRPVVAAVQGRALAGGCGLAIACDLVLAAESARFGFPEVQIGFVPAMVMAILRRNVGEKRAFDLVSTGRTVSATEAERLGLLNRVINDKNFSAEVEAFVTALASRSETALRLIKRLLYSQDTMGYEAAIRAGSMVNVLARSSEDARGGIERFLTPQAPERG